MSRRTPRRGVGRHREESDATARKWHTMTKMGEYDPGERHLRPRTTWRIR
jgi:hypothetical protein